MAWNCTVLTAYPDYFPGPLASSLSGKALLNKIWALNIVNIRDYGLGKHKKIDDTVYGGGCGMLLLPEVLDNCLQDSFKKGASKKLVYLTPRGKPLLQKKVVEFSESDGITILCGHFEGIDQRILDKYKPEEISLGDYILSGGEIASFVLVDSCVRMLPGVLGNSDSFVDESFNNYLLEHSQYTKPQDWQGYKVPDVLLSGNHKEINNWRLEESIKITKERRPELYKSYKDNNKRK